MITVHTRDGEEPFPQGGAYTTDEHNNLEVLTGPDDGSAAVFAEGYWLKAVVDGES